MREILFRGKALCDDEWVEGSLHIEWGETDKSGNRSRDYRILGMRGECTYVDPTTVGQYTGLKDKNGKRIFEGDVIHFTSQDYFDCDHRGYIVFDDGCFAIKYKTEIARKYGWDSQFHRIGEIEEWQDMGARGTITYTYEVIGNIHDNPELLKGD